MLFRSNTGGRIRPNQGRRKSVALDEDERLSLESLVRTRCGTGVISDRYHAILRCADGLTNKAIASELDMAPSSIGKWLKLFLEFGVEGLSGRPRMDLSDPVTGEKAAEVIDRWLNKRPVGAARWSEPAMADEAGLSKATIRRMWAALGVYPRPWKMLELSSSPLFVEKVRGIGGFYLSPPDRAMVLCVENGKGADAEGRQEKEADSALALDPAQPVLPIVHGESRNRRSRVLGSNPLLIALDVVTGVDVESNCARDRAGDLHDFMQDIDSRAPHDGELYIIVDNDFIQTAKEIGPWIVKRPRWHVHVAPNPIAWAYQAERWFGELTRKGAEPGDYASVRQLTADIRPFLKTPSGVPKPFRWTAFRNDCLVTAESSSPRDERASATNRGDNGPGECGDSWPVLFDGRHGDEIGVSGDSRWNTQQKEGSEDAPGNAVGSNARPRSKYDHTRLNRTSELFQLAAVSNLNTVFDCNDYEVFDRAVQALLDARHVLVVGMDPNHVCAIHMHQIATIRFRNWQLAERIDPISDRNLADLSPVDVVVIIAPAPCRDLTLTVADRARSLGARVIGLTD